jgi:lipid II:glycine glycyltransferase (peptidoglycan interpeptide bridge formation enzyme)
LEETVNNKEKYRRFCKRELSLPIFSKDWWLDAVCGKNNWDVAIMEKGGEIVASMPYMLRKKYCLTICDMPQLTQTLGPWLKPSEAKYAKQLSNQKKIMHELIRQLPRFDYFAQNFHYSVTNWLPFYWDGFEQTTRYTYVIDELVSEKHLWNALLQNIRTDIKKAENRFNLDINTDINIDEFLNINELTFAGRGKKLPYSRDLVKRIENACIDNNCRKIFYAQDKDRKTHAAIYVIWDVNSAYYLMGGSDPGIRNSGATSLCIWEAIKFSSTVTQKFDFEGSMIESVERFFRAFGAMQVPYLRISKTNSRLLKLLKALN